MTCDRVWTTAQARESGIGSSTSGAISGVTRDVLAGPFLLRRAPPEERQPELAVAEESLRPEDHDQNEADGQDDLEIP